MQLSTKLQSTNRAIFSLARLEAPLPFEQHGFSRFSRHAVWRLFRKIVLLRYSPRVGDRVELIDVQIQRVLVKPGTGNEETGNKKREMGNKKRRHYLRKPRADIPLSIFYFHAVSTFHFVKSKAKTVEHTLKDAYLALTSNQRARSVYRGEPVAHYRLQAPGPHVLREPERALSM